VALKREEHGRAQRLYEEGLALSREMSETWWLAYSLSNLALVTHYRGNSARATELYEESMDLFREQGSKYNLAACLSDLAMVVYSQGDLRQAAQLTEEGITLFRELGARREVAPSLCNLGWIALLQDDLGRASELYRESLSLSWDAGLNPVVQKVLEAIACVAGAKGEAERTAQLWGAAQALHQTKGIPRAIDFLDVADGRISAVRSGMGEEAWEEAWRRGREMTLDEAVSYALEEEETNPLTTPAPEELSAGQALVVLTRREEEVASLVAQGISNRQIAQELSISDRTVENHITKILKKQGFTSRTHIATWVAQR
jgi:DNA-binding CsgD family transcriptional regulator/tetratricopeptide (TPR) repeat protein